MAFGIRTYIKTSDNVLFRVIYLLHHQAPNRWGMGVLYMRAISTFNPAITRSRSAMASYLIRFRAC